MHVLQKRSLMCNQYNGYTWQCEGYWILSGTSELVHCSCQGHLLTAVTIFITIESNATKKRWWLSDYVRSAYKGNPTYLKKRSVSEWFPLDTCNYFRTKALHSTYPMYLNLKVMSEIHATFSALFLSHSHFLLSCNFTTDWAWQWTRI